MGNMVSVYISPAGHPPTRAGVKALGVFLQAIADTTQRITTEIDGMTVTIAPWATCPVCKKEYEMIHASGYFGEGYCSFACQNEDQEKKMAAIDAELQCAADEGSEGR